MRNLVAVVFIVLLSFVSKQGSAQQANVPSSSDKITPAPVVSQADTLNVITNQPKKITDYYAIPVPVGNTGDTAAILVNPVYRKDDPH